MRSPKKAEKFARKYDLSRSELYVRALAEHLRRQTGTQVTELIQRRLR